MFSPGSHEILLTNNDNCSPYWMMDSWTNVRTPIKLFLVPALPETALFHPAIFLVLPTGATGVLKSPQAFLCPLHLPQNRIGIHVFICPETLFCSLDCAFRRNIRVAPICRWIITRVIRIQIFNLLSLALRKCIRELLSGSRSDQTKIESQNNKCKVAIHSIFPR